MRTAPRVAREGRTDVVLGCGPNDVDDAPAADRPAEEDEAFLDERVHELRVLPPAGLPLQRLPARERGARLADEHVEEHYAGTASRSISGAYRPERAAEFILARW